MSAPNANEITEILRRISDGDRAGLDALTPLVYQELRVIARHLLNRERRGHTL